jgi:large subunit ribosomal protein L6e
MVASIKQTPKRKTAPVSQNKLKVRPTKLRKSITPGTVLILLAGAHKGKRVVFLKQLPSGLLLVTGPYKVNGVPLRRVNQAYVIATSTKVDVSAVDLSKVSDALFSKAADAKKSGKKTAEEFQGETAKKTLPAAFVALQKTTDAAIVKAVNKDKLMVKYLKTAFSLSNGTLPHELKF